MSDDFVEAARLYAGAVALARRAGTVWPNRPQTREHHERTMAALTPAELAAATGEGARLTLEELSAGWPAPPGGRL